MPTNTTTKRGDTITFRLSARGIPGLFFVGGREIRVLVKPNHVSEDALPALAREISKKIEENLQFPGQIKVVVIRETRVEEVAK